MSTWDALDAILRTDPQDAGCDHTRELLHVYVETIAVGGDPERELPGISAHLAACGPCAQDYEGLLAAVRADGSEGSSRATSAP